MTEPNDARRRAIDDLFDAVLSVDATDRAAFLERRCPEDPELRQEVLKLLGVVDRADRLRTGAGMDMALRSHEGVDEEETREGQTIRGYRLVERIGTGGMGEVWKAEQLVPVKRLVALKLIRRGMDSKEVVARFESERQALAIMNHPSIARVFDGGVSEHGRPFFVMELVRGTPITEYCDENKLSTHDRLRLFTEVCAGVQHAHHKGIIHRDIKPSNVLITTESGPAVPKIIDFGVARAIDQRLTDKPLHTKIGSIIGTPGYMSPEQFEMGTIDVDTRADVYSLGTLLYEMLTSLPPFDWDDIDQVGFDDLRQRIRQHEPTRPSTRVEKASKSSADIARLHRTKPAELVAELRGDLDWIVLKALEKDRTCRYDSPHELALDVERHLRDEPVSAGPPSAQYRLSKFTRRNRTALAVVGTILFSIVGAGVALTYALVESNRQKTRAEEALVAAEEARSESDAVAEFLSDMIRSAGPRHGGRDVTVREIIDGGAETIDERFGDTSLVGARLRSTMGTVYHGLGDYEEARPLLESSLRIAESQLGAESADVTPYLRSLADLYTTTGEYSRATPLFERSLAIEEREHGPYSEEVSKTLVNFSAMLADSREHARAAAMLERSIAIEQRRAGANHPHVLALLNNVAVQLEAAGDHTRAREYCERALSAVEGSMSPDHPWPLTIRGNIADLFMAEGRADTALALHEALLADRERVFGDNHPHVALSLTSLGTLYAAKGDHEAALAALERAIGIQESKLGADNVVLTPTLRARASVNESMGALPLARADLERALAIDEAAEGDRSAEIAEDIQLLVRVLRGLGAETEAERLHARLEEPSTGSPGR